MRRALAALVLAAFAVAATASAAPAHKPNPAKSAPSKSAPTQPAGLASDMVIGAKTARVEVVEYASLSCPHCREFHKDVLKEIRAKYVETGKVRWVFREYPTEPIVMAVAGFQLARCKNADAKTYFDRLDAIFEAQPDIIAAVQIGQGRVKFEEIAPAMGVSVPEFQACLMDESANARITEAVQRAESEGVKGTPTLLVAGKLVPFEDNTIEGVSRQIDAALAAAARARKR
jgi:protein-disulfide isomerase